MKDERTWMSDMEKELADDADGRGLQCRKQKLTEYANRLTKAMGQGMGMDDLHLTMEMKKAAELAATVLENVWQKLHNREN